ncbi:MAG: cytochrome P460 family protein [Gammaproteobacteria bacterium]|nr:cytochrome P460 family protein [Gammaproteobacteria bacterium]
MSHGVRLIIVFTLLGASQAIADKRCPASDPKEPIWESRCYDGKVTLQNYDSPDSVARRAESTLAWDAVTALIDMQDPDASGQVVSGSQVARTSHCFSLSGGHLGWAHDVATGSDDIRMTGPVFADKGFDTHQRVRIFYSDGVIKWLQGGRKGQIPDGEVIVKQMYASNPVEQNYGADRVTGWAVMVKNSRQSFDGWIWYLFFFPDSPPYGAPLPVVYSQAGDSFCLSCHSAADNTELTFATMDNLKGSGQIYSWIDHTFPDLFTQTDKKAAHSNGTSQLQQIGQLSGGQQQARTSLLASLDRDVEFVKQIKALQGGRGLDQLKTKLGRGNEVDDLLAKIIENLYTAIRDHDVGEFLTYGLEIVLAVESRKSEQ